MKWQPIKTAPRDVRILMFCATTDSDPYTFMKVGHYFGSPVYDGLGGQLAPATHWMPLPKEPRK